MENFSNKKLTVNPKLFAEELEGEIVDVNPEDLARVSGGNSGGELCEPTTTVCMTPFGRGADD